MPEEWSEANRIAIGGMFAPAAWRARLEAAIDYEDYERTYYLDWLGAMFRAMGIPELGEEDTLRVSREATAWIIPCVRAAFPGAAETVRLLYNRRYTLNTASGESSTDLDGYLTGMGVRDCFSRLYGPDVVNKLKSGPEYYERMLDDAGVAPADALVVDDNAEVLSWVVQLGARAMLIDPTGSVQVSPEVQTVRTISDLPGIIEQWE